MKIILATAAAALMATAAAAQTTMPANPSTAPMTPSTTTPTDGAMGSMPAPMDSGAATDPSAPPAAESTLGSTDSAMLTERNGKWYNGDRAATRSEIAAYKKSKKAGNPG